ncbi:MAG: SDR family NAD(P)-dependent oxidoreductase [Caldilineaceae bacterium]
MQTILITGATDGIGLALARRYQMAGHRLILIGRRALADLADPLFSAESYCQADLVEPNCTAQISSWLHTHNITAVDLVIHNAALGYVGTTATQPEASIRELVQVNLWAPIALSHMLFPCVTRARGKICFITSVATAFPGPNYAVYTATKAALEGFVRSWQVELVADESPVRLQIIRPGATRTNMHAKSGADLEQLRTHRFPSPAVVALQVAQAVSGHERSVTLGVTNRLAHGVGSLLQTSTRLDNASAGATFRERQQTGIIDSLFPPRRNPGSRRRHWSSVGRAIGCDWLYDYRN